MSVGYYYVNLSFIKSKDYRRKITKERHVLLGAYVISAGHSFYYLHFPFFFGLVHVQL